MVFAWKNSGKNSLAGSASIFNRLAPINILELGVNGHGKYIKQLCTLTLALSLPLSQTIVLTSMNDEIEASLCRV